MCQIHRLMEQWRISETEVSEHAGCTVVQVTQVLDPSRFVDCPITVVARTRAAIQHILEQRGWSGEVNQLWCEFDEKLGSGPDDA